LRIVTDEQQAQGESGFDLAKKRDGFAARHCIEGGKGFVGNQQARTADQGARNGGALQLAAAELVWITSKTVFTQPQPAKKIERIFMAACGEPAVRFQNIFHLRADANEGMKAQPRLLWNTSDSIPPQTAQRSSVFAQQFAAFKTDGSRLRAIRGQQAKNGPRHGGFPAAGWAGERHCLAAAQPQTKIAERVMAVRIAYAEVLNLK